LGGVITGVGLASPGAGIGGTCLGSLDTRAGLPPRGLTTGAGGCAAAGAFAAFVALIGFEGCAAFLTFATLAVLRFATAVFFFCAFAGLAFTASFLTTFFTDFFAPLVGGLAIFLARFIAIGQYLFENSCLNLLSVQMERHINAPDTLRDP
jgi:hypothetical protein